MRRRNRPLATLGLHADKSGTLDFGEWVEWWLQKKRGYAWQEGSQGPKS